MDEGCRMCLLVLNAGVPAAIHSIWFDFLLILILILLNGFFSASEMAVVTLNENRIRKQALEGDAVSKQLLRFSENQSKFLATIQVGVTLAGFLSAAFGADRLAPYLVGALDPQGRMPWMNTLATVMITILVSFFSLVFGELVPKRIGMSRPEVFAKRAASVLRFCELVFSPFTRILNYMTNLVSRILGIKGINPDERVSEEEIRLMAEAGRASGIILTEEAEMINKVFELDDKEVGEVMTPRTAVLALNSDSSWEEAIELSSSGRYSRIPVYEDDLDNIIGVLHIKDLLSHLPDKSENFDLRSYMRPAHFVPETKSLSVLFREMRQHHISLAIVIDEYGGMDGIISMEDILEEIVGEIEDEYDAEEEACVSPREGIYIMDGRLTPEEAGAFIPELAAMEEDDAYDTMAGFVLSLLERIPEADEHPQVRFKDLRFTVLEMDNRRIARIRIERLPDESIDDDNKEEE